MKNIVVHFMISLAHIIFYYIVESHEILRKHSEILFHIQVTFSSLLLSMKFHNFLVGSWDYIDPK